MLRAIVALYRANPFRPHCNSRAGIHTVLCKVYSASPLCGPTMGPDCDFPAPPQ